MPIEFGEFFRGHPKLFVHFRSDGFPRETSDEFSIDGKLRDVSGAALLRSSSRLELVMSP
ncbi:MAG: hypothetical protein HZA93_16730 [Verrucomicrobia bacterium]|nr:hypothetical protein [Verrucomicrobiota bacterium]